MNKDPYDLTPVPKKDIFTYTDMTEEDFENLVDNLFFEHAKKIDGPWAEEEVLDFEKIYHFARDLRAVLAAANGPLQATTSKPLPVIPWSGSNLTEMEELLQKTQQLERENTTLREDKEILDWMNGNIEAIMFKYKPDGFIWDVRQIMRGAIAKEGQP